MESGLVRLLLALLGRMQKKIGTYNIDRLIEYVANNAAWEFPEIETERPAIAVTEENRWGQFLTSLDTAILSLLGEQNVGDDEIEATLDAVLASSLWERRLAHRSESVQMALKAGVVARAKYVWSNSSAIQRRGYFLAGVGLDTGRQLDAHAGDLGELLVQANGAILQGNWDDAIAAITAFAEIIFNISPFVPRGLPSNWRDILASWLKGELIVSLAAGNEDDVLQFIEHGLIYKLPWGMEAARVRGLAHNDSVGDFNLADFELRVAVASVETGSLNMSATLLMRSGFNSRLSAIKAVEDTGAKFTTVQELRRWLESKTVSELGHDEAWPTPETRKLWEDFIQSFKPSERQVWSRTRWIAEVDWYDGVGPSSGTPFRISHDEDGSSIVLTADYEQIGSLSIPVNPDRKGLLLATAGTGLDTLDLEYLGPKDIYPS